MQAIAIPTVNQTNNPFSAGLINANSQPNKSDSRRAILKSLKIGFSFEDDLGPGQDELLSAEAWQMVLQLQNGLN